jgi:hypothetical protein
VKPKDQKEVDRDDTANGVSIKIRTTKERLTAHGGLALMAEFNHGIGLRELTDRSLPGPGGHRGFGPSEVVDTVVLMLQGGGRSLEDLRELKEEESLMGLIGREEIPETDTVGDWLRRMGEPKRGQGGLEGLDGADALWAELCQCGLL